MTTQTETPFAPLADEIRARAEHIREMAAHDEWKAKNGRQLAATLDLVAIKVEKGEIETREALTAAGGYPPTETENEKLRRLFALNGDAESVRTIDPALLGTPETGGKI